MTHPVPQRDTIAQHLQQARQHLAGAQALLCDALINDGMCEVYRTASHAAQAYVMSRTGKPAASPAAACTQLLHLTLCEPLIDASMKKLLAEASSITPPVASPEHAAATAAKASQLIERIAYLLSHPSPQRERSDAP